mmetsp:Transcript_4376/g.5184  ORF Transcript_4376/g.5184 Transcript_4376/m.5184 type:complete len:265 (+) Transcript_4376:7461-8255(+)
MTTAVFAHVVHLDHWGVLPNDHLLEGVGQPHILVVGSVPNVAGILNPSGQLHVRCGTLIVGAQIQGNLRQQQRDLILEGRTDPFLALAQPVGEFTGIRRVQRPGASLIIPRIRRPALHVVTTSDQTPPVSEGGVHHLGTRHVVRVAQRRVPHQRKIRVLHNGVVQQLHLVVLQREIAQLDIHLDPHRLGGYLEHPLIVGLVGFGDPVTPVPQLLVFRIGHETTVTRRMRNALPMPRGRTHLGALCAGTRPTRDPHHGFHGVVRL